jgi:hypothetical protein
MYTTYIKYQPIPYLLEGLLSELQTEMHSSGHGNNGRSTEYLKNQERLESPFLFWQINLFVCTVYSHVQTCNL